MKLSAFSKSKYLWPVVLGFSLLVYAIGMLVTVMEIDGAVYAEISREMVERGNWLELFLKGQDWLDKPHFQFWMTAISFKVFGINSFSYKLPAVLFMLLGAFYTYRFATKFYSKKHGFLAALLLITSQHIITSNSDVRAEPYLTGLTIFSLYYLAIYLKEKKISQMLLGSLGLACLLMTKGLFTIIPPASGIGLALIYEKRWKEILHWQWIVIAVITLVFIIPTLYGYYLQFDSHPEKVIFGKQNVSGIKFFLWDSQWGRFTNTGPIKGSGDPAFFLHTMLWAYLPWAFIAYFALFNKGKSLIRNTNKHENYTFFGFVFLFIVFSLSSFQLPHYLNALFPFLSVITADAILRLVRNRKILNAFYHIQMWSAILLMLAVLLIHFTFSDVFPKVDTIIIFILGIGIIILLLKKKGQKLRKIIFISAIVVLLANYYINRNFYPQLLTYQSESQVALYMKNHKMNEGKLVTLGVREEMVSFLQNRIVPAYEIELVKPYDLNGQFVFTNNAGIDRIKSMKLNYEEIQSFPDFRITTLNGTFLNKKTRARELEVKYLLEIQ